MVLVPSSRVGLRRSFVTTKEAVVSDSSRNQRAIVGRAMLASAVIMFALAAAFGFDA